MPLLDSAPESPAAVSPHRPSSDSARLVSLDVFRGLVIAGMILVTDPGTYSAVYWPLRHAEWQQPTPTDMIFPAFLVMVGMAMTLAFAARLRRGVSRAALLGHVAQRSVVLIALGLLLNGFPHFHLATLRLPGILQRIAVCYLLGSLLYLFAGEGRRRVGTLIAVTFALLVGYWAVLELVPVPGFGAGRLDSLGNVGAYVDRAVFGTRHMWAYGLTPGHGVTYDPEGIVSTLGALATLLLGVLAGEWMRSSHRSREAKALGLAAGGLLLALAGLLLAPAMPLTKKIWTPTFAVFSAGVTLAAFAVCFWLVDIVRWRRWLAPLRVLGTNAIFAFALSTVITALLTEIHVPGPNGTRENLHAWIYHHWFATWLPPVEASLLYALGIVAINILLVLPLYRRRIFLRI